MSADQGRADFSYAGLKIPFSDVDFTDQAGIAPTIFMVTVLFPPGGLATPPIEGDIVLTQDGRRVVFKNCRIDMATFEAGSGGQVALVRFFDERWKWQVGYTISGIYNSRLIGTTLNTVGSATNADNTIDPLRERKPSELISLLFSAMNVSNYDASLLSSDSNISSDRPYCEWDVSSPAQQLQSLLDGWGVRLVPIRSKGIFRVCTTGVGASLPDNLPYQDPSLGIDPKEIPDGVRVYGNYKQFQVRLKLEAVGKEIFDQTKQPSPIPTDPKIDRPLNNADGSWKAIGDLTYKPAVVSAATGGLGIPSWEADIENGFQSLLNTPKVQQPDLSYVRPYDLAVQYICKVFRLAETVQSDGTKGINVPGYVDSVTGKSIARRRQIILTDHVCLKYFNSDGVEVQGHAYCDFSGRDELWQGAADAPYGTRLNRQSSDLINPDEVTTFTVDAENGLVFFSHRLTKSNPSATALYPSPSNAQTLPADVWITCAVMVRDSVTWQPVRYTKDVAVPGSGKTTVGNFVQPLRQDDIQYLFTTLYSIDPTTGDGTPQKRLSNQTDCDKAADYYLNATLKTFETPNALTRTYIGMYPIDMDGAINQVSYTISESGANTKVSRGTEHDVRIPQYKEMQRRNALNKAAAEAATLAANPFKPKVTA